MRRFWRHVAMTPSRARRCFPDALMDEIARSIGESEKAHRGEICFVVEAELSTAQLWAGLKPRDRAREIFASQCVWNTEENNGVLIYVLLAEHDVEIVADRGIDGRVEKAEWQAVVDAIDAHFRDGRFREGALAGIAGVSALLARHFPENGQGANQLGNRPILM